MGLLDSVIGGALGGALGRGGYGGGRMRGGGLLASPVVKALLIALAAKAAQEYMHRQRAGAALPGGQAPAGGQTPAGGQASGGLGGVLGGILGGDGGGGLGGLGGLLGGLGGAGVLGSLVDQFNRGGHGEAIGSWVGRGPNQLMQPHQLAEALGPDHLAELERETGLPPPELLAELSRELPEAIDHITPEGRLPTDEELMQAGG